MSKLRARHANCSVIDCKTQHKILYSVPAPEVQRKQWLRFIFNNNVPTAVSAYMFVCANHFTQDCFNNWGQYRAGYASTLILIKGSLPTLREPPAADMPLAATFCSLLPPQTASRQPISAASQQHHHCGPAHSEICMNNEGISTALHGTRRYLCGAAVMSWKKCVLGCEGKSHMFTLPKEENTRKRWVDFLFGNREKPQSIVYVCSRHFTDDAFVNGAQYHAGFAARLVLKSGAVPSLKCQVEEPEKLVSTVERSATHFKTENGDMPITTHFKTENSNMISSQQFSATHVTTQQGNVTLLISPKRTVSVGIQCSSTCPYQSFGTQLPNCAFYTRAKATVAIQSSPPMSSVGTQCFSTVISKSAATQLSHGTLTYIRSKGTQVNLCCNSDINMTSQRDSSHILSSPPKEAPSLGAGPAKRPRIEIKEEEEDEEIMAPISPSEIRQMESSSQYNEPKYIVFESCLRALFETCPLCMLDCEVQQQKLGTYVSFSQRCPNCLYSRTWQSQPIRGSTPVGDLQMSAAIYFTNGSFPQVKKICKAVNLQMFPKDTFNRHVRMFLEPAIIHKWKHDQQTLIQTLRLKQKEVAVGGFIQTYPPGSAKFSSCTHVSLKNNHIIDVQPAQIFGASKSSNKEKDALRRGLSLLNSNHLKVDYIVTDCNAQVQEYLKEQKTTQYYDVCHFERGLSKKLKTLAKKRKFKVVRKWLPAIKKHIYYTARSSRSGPEKVAKWKSLINCFQNIHKHDEPLFPRCAHSDEVSADTSKWLQPGSETLHRVEQILMNEQVLHYVENLSHQPQISSMEDFQRDVLRFAPKKENTSFIEKLCRLYLAAMHFNENVERERGDAAEEKAVNKNMLKQSGRRKEATRHLKAAPTCNHIRDLMTLLFEEVLEDPQTYTEELKQIPIPEDLHTPSERPS